MNWPSQRIPYGSIFHSAKANYSPATEQFLKILIAESKLTTRQRNRTEYFLRQGSGDQKTSADKGRGRRGKAALLKAAPRRRRTYEDIVGSGAYEREQFAATGPQPDRKADIERLQNIMARGKKGAGLGGVGGPPPPTPVAAVPLEDNRFDQLVREIRERVEFLEDMEAMGQADKHRFVIQRQIEEKVREMERLTAADD